MPQCVVIADDLTGANATGVLLKKYNYSAFTIMDKERSEPGRLRESDCILYPTYSRAADTGIAYDRVYKAVTHFKDDAVKVYSKRIDSTLRGNLGSETDAMLDALDNQAVAMVVPCFPEAHRILVGGYLLVNSVLLHKTGAAADPVTPVRTSEAVKLYEEQSKYPVASVFLSDMEKGMEYLVNKIRAYKEAGIRIIIFDSITQEDINLAAEAVIESNIRFIAVDPGSFTAAVMKKLAPPKSKSSGLKLLAVVGSINPVAAAQLEELHISQEVCRVFVSVRELLEGEGRRQAEVERTVDEVLDKCGPYEICIVAGDGIRQENRIDLASYADRYHCTADEISSLINSSFAAITYRILKKNSSFKGLYTSGGDITAAVSVSLGAAAIRLLDEVVPLAAYGELLSGEFDGLKLVTKGGMAGDKKAMLTCMNYLRERLYN